MNKRVRELAKQAGLDYYSYDRYGLFDEEKFAQLIVQECAEVCRNWTSVDHIFTPDHMADLILNHFGADK